VAVINLFFATGQYSGAPEYFTSPDGVVWTERTGNCTSFLIGTKLLATRATGTTPGVYSSVDGINWTRQSTAVKCYALGSAEGGGRMVAVSQAFNVGTGFLPTIVSTDQGVTWSAGLSTNTFVGSRVAHNGSYFLAWSQGYNDDLETYTSISTDGISWTRSTTRYSAHAFRFGPTTVFWNGSLWVAMDQVGKHYTSSDGLAWTQQTASSALAEVIPYGGGPLGAATLVSGVWHVPLVGGGAARSTDGGLTWTKSTAVPTPFWPRGLAGYPGKLVSWSTDYYTPTKGYSSVDDGVTWTEVSTTIVGALSDPYTELFWAGATGAGATVALPRLTAAGAEYAKGRAQMTLPFSLSLLQPPEPPRFWTHRVGVRERP
jgi:hypothetical protein